MSDDDIGREEIVRAEDDLMHSLIEEAKRGDKDLARNLLWQFHCYVECGQPVPSHLLKYLAECFQQIVDGDLPPGEALHIEGFAYRSKAQDSRARDKAIAQMVLMRANRDHHKGAVERARDWVVKETGFSCAHVDHAYEQFRGELLAFHERYETWPLIMRPPRK